jgi:hypothetical protein
MLGSSSALFVVFIVSSISKPMQSQIEGTVNASKNDDDESPILDKGKG